MDVFRTKKLGEFVDFVGGRDFAEGDEKVLFRFALILNLNKVAIGTVIHQYAQSRIRHWVCR